MSQEEAQEYFIEDFRLYVASVHWKTAWTYQKFAPHEYTVSEWNNLKRPTFELIVMGIRRNGYKEKFGKTTYTYFNLDGKKYWTMGSSLKQTTLINRAKVWGSLN